MLNRGDMVKNRYKILKKLNQGGMGVVHLATDGLTGTYCVVKEPRFDGHNDSYKLKKLQFEANILKKIQHPNIVKYIDSHDTGTTFFLVTEYIHGENLRSHYRNRPLSEKKVEEYTLQILDALEYLHRRSTIHRDISPDNFMICNNAITMIDLGTARKFYGFVNPHQTAVGKQWYTPSEQWKRGESILQSDIYALGRTMIFLLTGSPPICQSGTVPLTCRVSDHMKSVIVKATQEIPAKRFSCAYEMKLALTRKTPISIASVRKPQIIINGQSHLLTRYSYIIGSSAADINIEDPHNYISRKHARISKDAFDQYWIEDGCDGNPSVNGVFVLQNGKYIKKNKWALMDGDIIALCYKEDKGPYITMQYRGT
jgi:serine/threonine protein kinase